MADAEQSGATPEEFKAITGVDNDPNKPPFGVAVTQEAVSAYRVQKAEHDQSLAARSEADVVQGVTTEVLPSADDPVSEAESLLEDFKKLNEIYNGKLLYSTKSEEGDRMLFAGALMVDDADTAYMGGIDSDGMFLVKGGAVSSLYHLRRNRVLDKASIKEVTRNVREASEQEYGKSEEVRVTDSSSMDLWEKSYRATKERIDMSKAQLPNIKKARGLVAEALNEPQKPLAQVA